MDQKLAVEQHARVGNLPAAWRSVAGDLLLAAAVLRERRQSLDQRSPVVEDPAEVPDARVVVLAGVEVRLPDGCRLVDDPMQSWRLHPSELMLMGMAIECLLKAIWVKQGNNKLSKDGKYIKVPVGGQHNLVKLAGAVKFPLPDAERDVLQTLSLFIEYGGRYPIPKAAEKLKLARSPRGGRAAALHWVTPCDQLLFDAVVRRLDDLLDEHSA